MSNMQIFQTNTFKKAYKKLHENQLKAVNEAIRDSMKDPKLGILKKEI